MIIHRLYVRLSFCFFLLGLGCLIMCRIIMAVIYQLLPLSSLCFAQIVDDRFKI